MPLLDDTGMVPDPWVRVENGQNPPEGAKVILSLDRLTEEGAPEGAGALGVHVGAEVAPETLAPLIDEVDLVSVAFPAFADGRGFSIGRKLRALGFAGELRAHGPLIADQFAALRACGFDAVELPEAMAKRQPAEQWAEAARAMSLSYQKGYALGTNALEARRAARTAAE